MTQLSSPKSATKFRSNFLGDPAFRDELANQSGDVLAKLLGPLKELESGRDEAATRWSTHVSYPDKKDQEVKYW